MSEETLHNERYQSRKKMCEKTFNFISFWKMQITLMKQTAKDILQNDYNGKDRQFRVTRTHPLLTSVPTVTTTVEISLMVSTKTQHIHVVYTATPSLRVYSREVHTRIQQMAGIRRSASVVFVMFPRKQPKCPATVEWIQKSWIVIQWSNMQE